MILRTIHSIDINRKTQPKNKTKTQPKFLALMLQNGPKSIIECGKSAQKISKLTNVGYTLN